MLNMGKIGPQVLELGVDCYFVLVTWASDGNVKNVAFKLKLSRACYWLEAENKTSMTC